MSDFPVALAPDLSVRLSRVLDVEGKIPRALDALGPMSAANVVLVDGDGDLRANQLAELGAHVTVVDGATPSPLADVADASADIVASFWSWFRDNLPASLASAERVLRPGGRLLVVHDYGRDDVSRLRPASLPEYTTWGRRDGWFLRSGFKVRVIHCWWTFESVEDGSAFLDDAFGEAGRAVAAEMKRPRLSYNVAIYHRTKGGQAEDHAG